MRLLESTVSEFPRFACVYKYRSFIEICVEVPIDVLPGEEWYHLFL